MSLVIERIQTFVCPKWEELPTEPLFNREVVTYVNHLLEPIYVNEVPLTTTMVQNYSKWHLISEISGRKYGREQIALLIIIVIYKQVLNTEELKAGMELQLKLMPLQAAYNVFASAVNMAVQGTFKHLKPRAKLYLPQQELSPDTAGVQVIANAFAQKLLGRLIIEAKGYQHMEERL